MCVCVSVHVYLREYTTYIYTVTTTATIPGKQFPIDSDGGRELQSTVHLDHMLALQSLDQLRGLTALTTSPTEFTVITITT